MRTLEQYLDMARARAGISSDRELSRRLGISGVMVNQYRRGLTHPGADTMLRIAELAGVDLREALLDLVLSKPHDDKTRAVWERIRQRVVAASVAGCIILSAQAARAAEPSANSRTFGVQPVYIITNWRSRWTRGIYRSLATLLSNSAVLLAWGARRGRAVSLAAKTWRYVGHYDAVATGALV